MPGLPCLVRVVHHFHRLIPHLKCSDFLLVLGEMGGGGGKTSSSKMAPPAPSRSDPEKDRFRLDFRCCCCCCCVEDDAELL